MDQIQNFRGKHLTKDEILSSKVVKKLQADAFKLAEIIEQKNNQIENVNVYKKEKERIKRESEAKQK